MVAIVNGDDAPFLTGGGGRVGYFYLDPTDALLQLRLLQKSSPDARLKVVTLDEVYFSLVRGEQGNLGGDLRLRPSRRQVVLANRALQFNVADNVLLPKTLDEEKGQVPVFYSERVAFDDGSGGGSLFPFFLIKEDLDAAYDQLAKEGKVPPETSSTKAAGQGQGQASGIPIGLVRVATLDGLIDQMVTGEIDLSRSVVVGSQAALATIKQLVEEGAIAK